MKHAFLIMAHNEPEILNLLLSKLYHEDNVCFVHIDKKVSYGIKLKMCKIVEKYEGVIIDKPINVKWGNYSQIRCEMLLFEEAFEYPVNFDYYHLLSGVNLPLYPIQYIHRFFELHKGAEFFVIINEDSIDEKAGFERINYYHLYTCFGRRFTNILLRTGFAAFSIKIQKMIGVSRCKSDINFSVYKGSNWCSITHNAVEFLLSRKKDIFRRFKYTMCADEVYKQTIFMNSPFAKMRYVTSEDDRMKSNLREIDWSRGNPYTWKREDIALLSHSPNLFARKFSIHHRSVIDYIREHI